MNVPDELIVVSTDDDNLSYCKGFVKAIGSEDCSAEENYQYLDQGGDFWLDSDKVRFDGTELYFNLVVPYIACDFDPLQYDGHVELIKRWLAAYKEQKHWNQPNELFYRDDRWETWEAASAGVAYRGGQGYTYGLYFPKESI